MADIEIKCSNCGALVKASEFAAVVKCSSCGVVLKEEAPSSEKKPVSQPALKLKRVVSREEAAPAENISTAVISEKKKRAKEQYKENNRFRISDHVGGWIVFVLLGLGMWFLRYGEILPANLLDLLQEYGPYIFLALHGYIILAAFKDSVFAGIMCLLVPPYAYYYLFIQSDRFYLRAVMAGMLAGIGIDSYEFLSIYGARIYNAINNWILSGG